MDMLQEIANRQRHTLEINLSDLEACFDNDPAFVENVETNTYRYLKVFAEAADDIMPSPTISPDDMPSDVFDVFCQQRQNSHAAHRPQDRHENGGGPSLRNQLPRSLLRRYDVYIQPRPKARPQPLRSVGSEHIGRLVKVKGVVTHITDVKPLVSVVAYLDSESGMELYQEVLGKSFMPLEAQKEIGTKAPPQMETRGSKLVKFQEAKIQEMADEVPEGATPRTISVHLRGDICRSMKPGDEVIVSGIFLPEPSSGFKAMRAGLLTTTHLEVMKVEQVKTSYTNHTITEDDQAMIHRLAQEGDIYNRLARSLAPEIWGHEDVKKALLLTMVGGVTKHMADGMRLRGDVHLCLMGDPGVAKSQLLKYVARVSPRAVYTTGRGSSGVGLTAAVVRNQLTRELVLEGGALVLADRGICCIDEFDKMEESDRTAIHEVMEQQTVSIAKAGITTTLNTRTTILAAANPAWGRYDKRRTPAENINLPAALLSRFDLLWLILDEVDPQMDRFLAEHVLKVHNLGRAPRQDGKPPLSADELRTYIAVAKTFQPHIPQELTDYVAAIYSEMRQLEKAALDATTTYTTPRTLLSILRLSQAVAKLRFDNTVAQSDVDEALRLMRQSKSSLVSSKEHTQREDAVSRCYRAIREYALRSRHTVIPYEKITELVARDNISHEDIVQCCQEYAAIAVWRTEEDAAGNPIVHIPEEDLMM